MGKGSVNKVILIGNVAKDPEIRTFESGSKVAQFSLATNDGYKGKDGNWVDTPNFHNLKVQGKLVDVIEQYVHKGDKVYVEGSLSNGSYENKQGVKVYFTEIKVWDMTMLGSKGGSSDTSKPPSKKSSPPQPSQQTVIEEEEDDDLPF